MNIYQIDNIGELIHDNAYVGRGIVAGMTPDGKAAAAYFIMGRSQNSRNRVFELTEEKELFTRPYDASKVQDPSLIIYAALRKSGDNLVFTNGDQTDTIVDGFAEGKSFKESLESRCFEPDGPNFTPRISAVEYLGKADFSYEISILKSIDAEGTDCARYTFSYPGKAGLGHFIHTYVCDGNPIPTFQGEPERVLIPADIDEFTNDLWENLNEDNKISLYVRYTDPVSGEFTDRLINKYQ
ncbi:MAG: IMP cyclohydrolase [Lachnospiraceae bacterium]|nr:IMP cyclohydrolase [Lachnospiraceae bacterium]